MITNEQAIYHYLVIFKWYQTRFAERKARDVYPHHSFNRSMDIFAALSFLLYNIVFVSNVQLFNIAILV